jgi:hypothetical protein
LGWEEGVSWDGAGSLPIALSSLIGRQAELDTLATLIPRARLLTIVGTGGCGKTRLALAVAERYQPEFTGGVRWVGLETLVDPRLLPAMVGTAVGAPESPGRRCRGCCLPAPGFAKGAAGPGQL